MALLRKREKSSIDRRRSLAGIAILHDDVEVIEADGGNITLKMQVRRGYGFFERFRPPVTERKYELDEFGTFVVREVRKRKKVLAIVGAFERQFRMSHRESELGVVAFLKILMKRDILSVVVE